ncbi:MAG: hypothetical protein CVV23_12145 [Ignavibacteriae bacterium HGW-Ignavibacteriae-2]|jgi:beta-lactamase class A|nr:class A beta-lactamase-related serine hydrolase [Bacteroidota bacterium]PKL88091.1 MAG: hypothetical protein CVV23_12145 [Ignavibacteriae bacterium HGW-Ignavibacteriae-2]
MRAVLILFFIFTISFPAGNKKNTQTNLFLPYDVPRSSIKSLRNVVDLRLQRIFENKIKLHPKWKSLISNKKMAVGLVDISDPYNVKFARMNGDEMMYAASLPKIAVLLASFDSIEKGELEPTEDIMNDLRIMISQSNNQASTRMIDRLGYKKIESVLTDPKYDLYDEDYGGGLWVGKRYAKDGPRYPDPLQGLSHAATVTQVCRFYYLLAFGNLVNFERSEEMLEIMSDPELHHKFVNTLEKLAPDAKLYRKSGSWQSYHSDSILVWDNGWRRYILVALIDDPNGEQICRDLVPVIEDVLKTAKG